MGDGSSQLWDGGPSSSAWPAATPPEPPCGQHQPRAGPSSELEPAPALEDAPSSPVGYAAMAVDDALDEEPTLQPDQPWEWAVGDEYQQSNFGDLGVYLKRKRIKLAHQRDAQIATDPHFASRPPIFQGIAIYINGKTETPLAALSEMLTLHSGTYVPYLDKKSLVTHIVASNLTPKKRQEFKAYKVVTEAFITESVAAGKLLPWQRFKLEGAGRALGADVEAGVDGASMQRTLVGFSPTKTAPPMPVPVIKDGVTTEAVHPWLPSKRNERAAALLQDEDWRLKHTAVSPDYLASYFATSRLHHLSQWKAALPALLTRLCGELEVEGKTVKAAIRPPTTKQRALSGTAKDGRVVFHVDFDSFFTSVAVVTRPHLLGKPIAVCHATDGGDMIRSTSEIASCSYEARSFGVRNGMSLGRARELCPDIQTVPYQFHDYETKSAHLYRILLQRGTAIQPVSVDEAYIELADVELGPGVLDVAESIRTEIREATGCEASIGIGHNLVLARLATIRAKPASAFWVAPDTVADFLAPLSVDDLPKIGWSSSAKLGEIGVATLADARRVGLSKLQTAIGKQNGQTVLNFAHGIDPRRLEAMPERKIVSVELNYGIRFKSDDEVETFLRRDMCPLLVARMSQIGVRGRKITLKIMRRAADADKDPPKFLGHGRCDTSNHSDVLRSHTADADAVAPTVVRMMRETKIAPEELRGIAVSMQDLVGEGVSTGPEQRTLSFKPVAKTPKPVAQPAPPVVIASDDEAPAPKRRRTLEPEESLVMLDGPPPDLPPSRRGSRPPSVPPVAPRQLVIPSVFTAAKPGVKRGGKGPAKQTHFNTTGTLDDLYRFAERMPKDPSPFQLTALGIDPEVWAQVGNSMLRHDVWSTQYDQRKVVWRRDPHALNEARKAFGVAMVDEATILSASQAALPQAPPRPSLAEREMVAFEPLPVFKVGRRRAETTQELRDFLTEWFDAFRTTPVLAKDVDRLGDHLVRINDPAVHRFVQPTKTHDVLRWWRVLVEERGSADAVGESWRRAFNGVRERVQAQIALSRPSGKFQLALPAL